MYSLKHLPRPLTFHATSLIRIISISRHKREEIFLLETFVTRFDRFNDGF